MLKLGKAQSRMLIWLEQYTTAMIPARHDSSVFETTMILHALKHAVSSLMQAELDRLPAVLDTECSLEFSALHNQWY